jgi:hypothetical protein
LQNVTTNPQKTGGNELSAPEPENTGVQGPQAGATTPLELVPLESSPYKGTMSETIGLFADKGITKSAILFVRTVQQQLEERVRLLETELAAVRAELKTVSDDAHSKTVLIARYEEQAKNSFPVTLAQNFLISIGALLLGAYFSATSQPLPSGVSFSPAWYVTGITGAVLFIGGWLLALVTRSRRK